MDVRIVFCVFAMAAPLSAAALHVVSGNTDAATWALFCAAWAGTAMVKDGMATRWWFIALLTALVLVAMLLAVLGP